MKPLKMTTIRITSAANTVPMTIGSFPEEMTMGEGVSVGVRVSVFWGGSVARWVGVPGMGVSEG